MREKADQKNSEYGQFSHGGTDPHFNNELLQQFVGERAVQISRVFSGFIFGTV